MTRKGERRFAITEKPLFVVDFSDGFQKTPKLWIMNNDKKKQKLLKNLIKLKLIQEYTT